MMGFENLPANPGLFAVVFRRIIEQPRRRTTLSASRNRRYHPADKQLIRIKLRHYLTIFVAAVRSALQLDAGGVDDLLPSLQLLLKEGICFRRALPTGSTPILRIFPGTPDLSPPRPGVAQDRPDSSGNPPAPGSCSSSRRGIRATPSRSASALRQLREPIAAGHRQRLDVAGGRETDHRRQLREHHLRRARQQVVERDPAAAVRHLTSWCRSRA